MSKKNRQADPWTALDSSAELAKRVRKMQRQVMRLYKEIRRLCRQSRTIDMTLKALSECGRREGD